MLRRNKRQLMLGVVAAAIVTSSPLAHADQMGSGKPANINLAVASNFYGVPPLNSAITDIITAFEAANPNYTVTVVDNGATSTLESHIINGNQLKVDLFLAADTETPLDLLTNHFDLVAPYNNSFRPPLYTFNYAQGVLAFLGNGVDVTCATGSCATIQVTARWQSPIQVWRLME
jgi:ABC-type glycerol-3-phosphate transport system substrate-binding protein